LTIGGFIWDGYNPAQNRPDCTGFAGAKMLGPAALGSLGIETPVAGRQKFGWRRRRVFAT